MRKKEVKIAEYFKKFLVSVEIEFTGKVHRWVIDIMDAPIGLGNTKLYGEKTFKSRQTAKNNFIRFAEQNGIKNYQIL